MPTPVSTRHNRIWRRIGAKPTRSPDRNDPRAPDSLLRVPGVRSLLAASLLSSIGSATALLAVAYVSFHYSHSLIHTVIVATAYSLPAAIVGMWAGRLADTHDHRHIIVVTDTAKVLIWIGAAVLDVAGWLNPAWLTLTALLAGLAGAIQYPSWQEFERQLVSPDRLSEANAAFSSLGALASVVGAVAGGIVVTWLGPAWTFAFNALTYVPLMIIVARAPVRDRAAARRVEPERLRDSLSYARHQQAVRLSIGLVGVLTFLAVPIASLLPALADELSDSAHILGIVTAFYGLGGSLVALVLRRLTKDSKASAVRLVVPAILACGLSLVVIGILGGRLGGVGRQIAVFALLIPIGLGIALAQAVLSANLQLSSSAEMEGRMIALYGIVVSLVAPIGGITLALISQAWTVWLAVAIAGALLTVFAAGMAVFDPAARFGADPARESQAAVDHGFHLGRYAAGFLHPGHFHPLTVGAGRRERPGYAAVGAPEGGEQ
jgi:predicted MFS family arabinose efflux permease